MAAVCFERLGASQTADVRLLSEKEFTCHSLFSVAPVGVSIEAFGTRRRKIGLDFRQQWALWSLHQNGARSHTKTWMAFVSSLVQSFATPICTMEQAERHPWKYTTHRNCLLMVLRLPMSPIIFGSMLGLCTLTATTCPPIRVALCTCATEALPAQRTSTRVALEGKTQIRLGAGISVLQRNNILLCLYMAVNNRNPFAMWPVAMLWHTQSLTLSRHTANMRQKMQHTDLVVLNQKTQTLPRGCRHSTAPVPQQL